MTQFTPQLTADRSGLARAWDLIALAPRNACIAVLGTYRRLISPLYGDVCRYYPSCSHYTLQAIQQHGAVIGIGLGAWRLLRCNPFSKGGVDDVPPARHAPHAPYAPRTLTEFGFVTTRPARKA